MSGVEETPLAVIEPTPLAIPRMPIAELRELTAYVNEVKKTLMIEGKDYVIDGNRQYTARSGFAKLHQGFTLSDEAPIFTPIYYDEPQEFTFKHRLRRELKTETISTKVYGFECIVKVINLESGRFAHGEGVCTLEELHQTNNMSPKWYHRLKATAKTRAWNRAVSNYVGSAEVSAEEMGLTYPGDRGSRASERKEVKSEKTDIYPLPKTPLDTPTWDFTQQVEAGGWDSVETLIVAYLFDMGFQSAESAFEYGHDVAKAWIRNAPGVYFGDGMKEIDTVLQIAGFQYHGGEKRWRYKKPEKPSEEKKPVVKKEKPPKKEPPKKEPPKKEPEPEEEAPPTGPPGSVDDVREKIAAFMPGHLEMVVVSDKGDYYRVGRKITLDKDVENHLDVIISEMGGEWVNDKNEWRIFK